MIEVVVDRDVSWKPPSTMSTLSGARGGDREESPYSIPVVSEDEA